MTRPRILHLFNSFEVGGVERQHMMLVNELAGKYHQTCWSYIDGPIQDELRALTISNRVGPFAVAREMIQQGDYDCVVLRTNRYMREMATYFIAHPMPIVYIRSFLRWFEGNGTYFDEDLERLSYSFPAHTFFSGPSLLESAMSLGMNIPGAEVLYNGVDMESFPRQPRAFPDQCPLRVGILANFSPQKNQHTAIRVMKDGLLSGRYTLSLGGEALYPNYAKKVQKAADGLPVSFKGYIDDVAAFFRDIDVLLLSSTHEGWPIVLMEAMACGLPVIAPRIGDTAELLGNGEYGILYPSGEYEQIPRLLDSIMHRNTYEKYALASVNRSLDFDIKTTAAKLDAAIMNVTGGSINE